MKFKMILYKGSLEHVFYLKAAKTVWKLSNPVLFIRFSNNLRKFNLTFSDSDSYPNMCLEFTLIFDMHFWNDTELFELLI